MAEPMSKPSQGSADYNAWVTLANDVSTALRENMDHHVLFSQREAIAEQLWEDGYRPSREQIEAEIERQRSIWP